MYEETIELNSTQRLVVSHDEWAESPLEGGWGTELNEIDNYRMWRGWDTPEEHFADFVHTVYYKFGRNTEVAERAARIILSILGDTRDPRIHEYRGYTKSDWATYLELSEPGSGSIFEAYAAWRRGDVYTVTLEERDIPAQVDVHVGADGKFYVDEYDEDWYPSDSIGGCYLDETYTAEQVAREYFDIKEKK